MTYALENSVRTYDYKGSYSETSACVCAAGQAQTDSSASLSGVDATDDKQFTLYANLEADGSYSIDVQLGGAVLRGNYHYTSSGCGDPEEKRDNALTDATTFGPVKITGKIDMTKSSGKLEGTVPVSFEQPIPDQLGGFYQGGVAQTRLTVAGDLHYSIDYILQNLTFPLPPPGDAPVSAQLLPAASSATADMASTAAPGIAERHAIRAAIACY